MAYQDTIQILVSDILMTRLPCRLAEASLVATAGSLTPRRMFTVDGLFHACRLEDGAALEVIP